VTTVADREAYLAQLLIELTKCRACGNPESEPYPPNRRWENLCGRCVQWYWWATATGRAVWPYERMFRL
jgi:hypothetical protein